MNIDKSEIFFLTLDLQENNYKVFSKSFFPISRPDKDSLSVIDSGCFKDMVSKCNHLNKCAQLEHE